MSDSKPQNDPSMDDILASIRKIISDDEARAAGPGGPQSAAAPRGASPQPSRPAPGRPAAAAGNDDVLLLTELVEEPSAPQLRPGPRPFEPAPTVVEPRTLPMRLVEEPQPQPVIMPIPSAPRPGVMDLNEPQPATVSAPLRPPVITPPQPPVSTMSQSVPPPRDSGSSVSAAFERLNRAVAESEPPPPTPPAAASGSAGGKSVEDLVREMLRPMLQEWMDRNLPDMVEKQVEREIARLTRR